MEYNWVDYDIYIYILAYAINSFIYKNNYEVWLNIGKNVTTINNKLFHH